MKVHIEINNQECRVLDMLNIGQLSVMQSVCSYQMKNSEFRAAALKKRTHGKADWDGINRLFNIQTQVFPIGLLYLVVETFNNAGIETEIINKRKINDKHIGYDIQNFESREYQNGVVMQSILNGNGIIKAATGSGKTTMAARTIDAIGKQALFTVHTRDLLYQTIKSFQHMFPGEKIGQIGDGIIDYQDINVGTMQTLSILGGVKFEKYSLDEDYHDDEQEITFDAKRKSEFNDFRKSTDVIMFDEVQRICSRTAYGVRFLFDRANYAFGYSASPWRDDGTDLMINAAFGRQFVDISATSLIEQGFLVRPIISIRRLKNNVWSGSNYEQIYKSAIVENTFRNMQVCQDAVDQWEQGRNTLILVTQIKHGETLEYLLRAGGYPATFISGKSRMSKRRQVIDDMRSGKQSLVIASTIADVGLDVPRLQSIVEAGAGKSSVTALQRLGRIMRPFEGKDLCYFITYHDSAPYIVNHIENKIRIWKTEPGFIINKEE